MPLNFRILPTLLAMGPVSWGVSIILAETSPPTFADDIAPIIHGHCIECHHPGGIGPFSLLTYDDVRRRATQVAEVTSDRYMPPWKPSSAHSPALQGDRSLPQTTIDLIMAWADAGAPAGDLTNVTPPALPASGWRLGKPDVVVEFPEPFTLPAEGFDAFQNFVLRIPITQRRFIRALEFLPDSQLVIHHAVIAFDPTPATRLEDEATPEFGYASMDLGAAVNPNGHIIGWTPGQVPYETYPGTAFELTPGTDLILQLHMLPSGKPEKVSPRVGLYFSDTPSTRTGYVLLLRENQIDIPAGAADYTVEESLTLPAAASVLSLYPHAHYLGRDLRIWADLPDGSQRWLMRIPDWDFNWQSDYRFVEPLPLPAGSTLTMRYSFDNTSSNPRNPSQPPVRVQAGWRSSDEMAEIAIQLLLDDAQDLPKIEEAQARYQLNAGERNPDTLYNLALALDRQGRLPEAAHAYEEALRTNPDHANSLNNLAAVRQSLGDSSAAADLYRRALRVNPALSAARRNLAKILRNSAQSEAAARLLRDGLAQLPSDLEMRLALAEIHLSGGQATEARKVLETGLPWHREDPRIQLQLGQACLYAQDAAAGIAHLEATLVLPLVNEGVVDIETTQRIQAEAAFTLALIAQQHRDLPALERRLGQTLTLQPDHRDALMMSAGVALIQDDTASAERHLAVVLRLPDATRPNENDVLSTLPYPEGALAWARALQAAGRRAEALLFLDRQAKLAHENNRSDWEQMLLTSRQQLEAER